MFFSDQLEDIIKSERRAFYSYLVWLLLIFIISILFIVISASKEWFNNQLGSTLSSAFLLLLSKPPFSEMMKRRERIKTLGSLQRMATLAPEGSDEAGEVQKLILKVFKDMLKK